MSDIDPAEYDWLLWFYQHADFGPGEEDVRGAMKDRYQQKTGKQLPRGYRSEDD